MKTRMTMNPSPLRELLRVALDHEYFGGGFSGFKLVPLPTTAAACSQLGLYMLCDGATITLYTTRNPQRISANAACSSGMARTTFCWEIIPKSPDFTAFTDLDFVGSRQRIVLTSASIKAEGGPLTCRATVSSRDLWALRPLRFDFQPSQPLRIGSTLTLEDSSGFLVRQLSVTDPSRVLVDVTSDGSGLYQLKRGTSVLAKWFADERGLVAAGATPSTMLVLSGPLVAAAFLAGIRRSVATADIPSYTAKYAARAVTWNYHVFNARRGEDLRIVPMMDGGVSLDVAQKSKPFVQIPSASFPTAVSFTGTKPLKFTQIQPQRFALLSGSATRYAPLPLAGLPLVRATQSPGFCSDILVHL